MSARFWANTKLPRHTCIPISWLFVSYLSLGFQRLRTAVLSLYRHICDLSKCQWPRRRCIHICYTKCEPNGCSVILYSFKHWCYNSCFWTNTRQGGKHALHFCQFDVLKLIQQMVNWTNTLQTERGQHYITSYSYSYQFPHRKLISYTKELWPMFAHLALTKCKKMPQAKYI